MNLKILRFCAGFAVATTSIIAGEAPSTADQLMKRFESAINAKDTNALIALVNWQGVSAKNKELASSLLTDDFNLEIDSVTLKPLPEDFQATNELDGIRYRPNVAPIGMIDVQFVKKENAVQSTQLPYGKNSDGFWIPGTIEEKFSGPSKTELAARENAEKAKESFKAHPELLTQMDQYGQTPLIQAARNGEKEMVEILLSFNVDLNNKDNAGRTALHWAADNGQVAVIKLLLAKKADVNAKSNAGWTPLHEASAFGQADAAILFLANQADINAKANDGKTALHLAALYGHRDIAALLIANKAEVNAKDSADQTPLAAAADTNSLPKYAVKTALPGKKSVADLLQQSGGKN